LNYFLSFYFVLSLFFQSCHSQETNKKNYPTRLSISQERSDSLALHVPPPTRSINDFVQLFDGDEIKTLDSLVSVFEKTTTVEIVVATVNSKMVKDHDFEDYTLVMMRMWGVGKKDKNNGVLIVISPNLRRIRIQNGYGIEKILSDSETKQIIDGFFLPKFKEAKYFEGTRDGIIALANKLKKNGL
jgi:uncharacterized protein